MKHILTFFLILFAPNLFACKCDFVKELSKADIDKTDYIALVRIKEILPVSLDTLKIDNPSKSKFYKIVVEEVTHYKGNRFKEIMVQGGNTKFDYSTSCDYDINENDEWLIFGRYEVGRPFVFSCSRSVKYRGADGFRDWQYKRGLKEVSILDKAFEKESKSAVATTGEVKYFFPNGNLEKIEHYKTGKLHGEIKYLYPDGKLYGSGFYYEGALNKTFTWYNADGSIHKKTTYNKGLNIDTAFYYGKGLDNYYLRYIHVYNKKGEQTLSQNYNWDNDLKKTYLREEIIYDTKLKKEKITTFFKSGETRSVQHKLNNKGLGEYIEYNKEGKIIRKQEYDETGKMIKNL